MSAYPLRTERLVLRPLREDDIDVIVAYRNDPDVAALQDWDLPVSRERVERHVAAQSDWSDIAPGEPRQIGIDLNGELIGDLYVGLASTAASLRSASPSGPSTKARGTRTRLPRPWSPTSSNATAATASSANCLPRTSDQPDSSSDWGCTSSRWHRSPSGAEVHGTTTSSTR